MPICANDKPNDFFTSGYDAGMIACSESFKRCEKLRAKSTRITVSSARRGDASSADGRGILVYVPRIAPGDAHIRGSAGRDAIDGQLGRLLEADDHDAVAQPHVRIVVFRKCEDEAGIAAIGAHTDIAAEGLGARGAGRSGGWKTP